MRGSCPRGADEHGATLVTQIPDGRFLKNSNIGFFKDVATLLHRKFRHNTSRRMSKMNASAYFDFMQCQNALQIGGNLTITWKQLALFMGIKNT